MSSFARWFSIPRKTSDPGGKTEGTAHARRGNMLLVQRLQGHNIGLLNQDFSPAIAA